MTYDTELAARIRALVANEAGVTEQKLFGGIAFLAGGNMAVAGSGQGGILVRVDPALTEALTADSEATVAEMRGRPMLGWLRVESRHLQTSDELVPWLDRGLAYARSLPAKP